MRASPVVMPGTDMPALSTSAFPPRRHLALTAVAVMAGHLALLGVSPVALGRTVAAPSSASAPDAPSAVPNDHDTAAATAHPGPGLRLSVAAAPAASPALSSTPTHPPAPPPSSSPETATEPTGAAASGEWVLAQASTDSDAAVRPNPGSNTASAPTKVPASTRLQFDVLGKIKGFGYTVSGELSWQQDGRQYQAKFDIGMPLLGSRVQTSQGLLGTGGLMPTRFGDKVRSEQAAHFERDKGIISFSANTPSTPLEAGAQDRLSLFFQLASLLAGSPQRYPTGSQITLQTVSAREAEPWTFRVDGPETLQIPLGSMPAIRLTRLPRQPHDQQVDLWFAPSLGYLPVRLRVTHPNGDVADQVLRRLDPPG
jgi:hypothetical protein